MTSGLTVIIMKGLHRGVAQLVARLVRDQEAGSSSLPTPTIKKTVDFRRRSFCYVKHSKNLNVPFPRPFGATGNDARKLHAHGFARFRGVLSAHEVLCCIHESLQSNKNEKNL